MALISVAKWRGVSFLMIPEHFLNFNLVFAAFCGSFFQLELKRRPLIDLVYSMEIGSHRTLRMGIPASVG